MEKRAKFIIALVSVVAVLPTFALGMGDPYLRDDDISGTEVTVAVSKNPQGYYVYKYDVKAPNENTGSILYFAVDISCPTKPDSRGFIATLYPSDASPTFSPDGNHVPVAIDAAWGSSGMFGISTNNDVHWGMVGNPGKQAVGLQLISPYPPGNRTYSLVPSVDYRWEVWDYSGITEESPVPWVPDWTVTGTTTGPACPGEEYPGGVESGSRFPGSHFAGETEQINELLSYSTPLRDQFHLPGGTHEVELTIHYGADIDPRTFKVTPERSQLRQLFNPKPGSSETVRIPLDPGKNRIELQVQSRFIPPGKLDKDERQGNGREGVSLDHDVFVFRIDEGNNGLKKK